eukprot:gene24321-60427_t
MGRVGVVRTAKKKNDSSSDEPSSGSSDEASDEGKIYRHEVHTLMDRDQYGHWICGGCKKEGETVCAPG